MLFIYGKREESRNGRKRHKEERKSSVVDIRGGRKRREREKGEGRKRVYGEIPNVLEYLIDPMVSVQNERTQGLRRF